VIIGGIFLKVFGRKGRTVKLKDKKMNNKTTKTYKIDLIGISYLKVLYVAARIS